MGLQARDVMQSQVLTLSPDEPLTEVQRLFFEEEIHGAPVVDDQGKVVGMLSTIDLLRTAADRSETEMPSPSSLEEREGPGTSVPGWDRPKQFQEVFGELTASDAMTDGAVTVAPDASIAEIAGAIRENRIHRVLVVEGGLLRGVVSTFDLVAVLEKET